MQVTIGIPTQWGLWRADMAMSLIYALRHLADAAIHLSPQNGPYLDENREATARDAISLGSDYIAFVDTDMQFPDYALKRLIDSGKDIIGANYYEKRFPLVSTVKPLTAEGGMADDGRMVVANMPHEPFEVAGLGAGLLVIKVSRMVEMMAPPYFAFADYHGKRMGEELAFATRARNAGLHVWCDPTIPVFHIGDFAFGKVPD